MTRKPSVLVLGSGFAGQGHAEALRYAGAEVVGMASRTESVVEGVAASLNIPYATTDWRKALEDLQPDIVAIGTPGGAHFEPVMAALDKGCHVFCDKPLAATAEEAKALYLKAKEARVKTAYAASYRYMPYVTFARELVNQGTIGEPQELECISHYNLDPLIPFGWSHRLSDGGGRLNNNFTHKLSIVLEVLEGTLVTAYGETRNDMKRAPVVSGSHDFRERRNFIPEDANDPNLEWAESDAEWSYTVLATIETLAKNKASVLFKHSGLQPRFNDDYIAVYGSKGALHIGGSYAQGPLNLLTKGKEIWETLELPEHITKNLPDIEDDTLRNWACLARAFVNDILGKSEAPYQTFEDGWLYQELIAAIRQGRHWKA